MGTFDGGARHNTRQPRAHDLAWSRSTRRRAPASRADDDKFTANRSKFTNTANNWKFLEIISRFSTTGLSFRPFRSTCALPLQMELGTPRVVMKVSKKRLFVLAWWLSCIYFTSHLLSSFFCCCWGAHLRSRSFHYHNHLFPLLVVVL